MDRIKALDAPTDMQIFVSLSCTMCPELVIAAQHIATLNPNVRAEAYDLNHFPALKETYNVMSVPCLVLNSEKVLFGKKSISLCADNGVVITGVDMRLKPRQTAHRRPAFSSTKRLEMAN